MLMPRLRLLSCLALAFHAGAPALAQASAYPSRPVTLIIPFTPGGSTEAEFRLYTIRLTETTGHRFIMDYKPGAGSMIGTAFVAKLGVKAGS